MSKNIKIKLMIAVSIFALFISSAVIIPCARADEILIDGVYNVPFTTDLNDMGMKAFYEHTKNVQVEKIGNFYYMRASFDSNVVKDIALESKVGKVGETVSYDGFVEYHTYTMDANSISEKINFSVYIIPMKRQKTFYIQPMLNSATRTGDIVQNADDRPAQYVPVINVNASDGEFERGSNYVLPQVNATMCNEEIPVTTKAFYIKNDEQEEVKIVDDKLNLVNVGEYRLVFSAQSDKYKTLLGNNAITTKTITLISKIGAKSLVKVVDDKKVLPPSFQIKANNLTSGDKFDNIVEKLKNQSDHYQIVDIQLLDNSGEVITLTDDITLYILASESFDRNKIHVYYVDENNFIPCNSAGYGRYMQVTTDKTGIFLLCVPGVAFQMPMWAIATLTIVGSVLAIGVIVLIVILIVKHYKKNKIS